MNPPPIQRKYFVTDEQRTKAADLWSQGLSRAEVAEQMGWKTRTLDMLRETEQIRLPSRGKGAGKKVHLRDMTPREIRSRAEGVRNNWTHFEELNRRTGPGRVATDFELDKEPPYEPKRYKLGFIQGSIRG